MNKTINYNSPDKSIKISMENIDLNLLEDFNFGSVDLEDLKSGCDSNNIQIVHENLEELIKDQDNNLPIDSSLIYSSIQEVNNLKEEPKPKKKGSKPRKPKAYDSMMTKWRFKK